MTLDRAYKIATIGLTAILAIAVVVAIPMWVGSTKSDVKHLREDVDQLQTDVDQLRVDVAEIRSILERGAGKGDARDTSSDAVDGMRVVPRQHDKRIPVVWQQESPLGGGLAQVGAEDMSE